MVNGYTRTCGLIGNPVEHTVSPVIHNYLAKVQGQNLVYVPFLVQPNKVEEAMKGAFALNILGCNVTVPYKSKVIPYLTELDAMAEKIGAVNTLVRTEQGFKGYNTDMPGLYRAMEEEGIKIEGEQVLILGAGGVARAVAVLFADKKAKRIVILNRTVEKAEAIAKEVNIITGRKIVQALPLQKFQTLENSGTFLAIQATNIGMYPKVEEAVIENESFYKIIHTGYDLIFNPSETKFMKLVKAQGKKAYGGLRMLLYQGIIAYELWTGQKVDKELAGKVYQEMCKAMKIS